MVLLTLKQALREKRPTVRSLFQPIQCFEGLIGYFLLQRSLQVGDVYTLRVFNLDLMEPVKTDIKVLQDDQFEFDGRIEPAYTIDYTMDIMGGLTTKQWLGHNGTIYRMEIGLMGLKMVPSKDRYANSTRRIGRS